MCRRVRAIWQLTRRMMRINEIFYSLQGEGRYTGVPAVFVRLSGCNLRCPFCDTDFSSYNEMSEEDIVRSVSEYPTRHIVITGGEPTLQLTASLLVKLHAAGFFVQIETNGTHPVPEGVDWITCSPKAGGRVVLTRVNEVKMLYQGEGTDLSAAEAIEADEYRLQPLDTGDADENKEITNATIKYILDNPKWKLSLQTHKILNVR